MQEERNKNISIWYWIKLIFIYVYLANLILWLIPILFVLKGLFAYFLNWLFTAGLFISLILFYYLLNLSAFRLFNHPIRSKSNAHLFIGGLIFIDNLIALYADLTSS